MSLDLDHVRCLVRHAGLEVDEESLLALARRLEKLRLELARSEAVVAPEVEPATTFVLQEGEPHG